jgi:beta-lactamase superfamily II metal-dependent hydrolase
VALTTCSGAFGQSDKNAEQAVMRIEKEMMDALLKGDAAARCLFC